MCKSGLADGHHRHKKALIATKPEDFGLLSLRAPLACQHSRLVTLNNLCCSPAAQKPHPQSSNMQGCNPIHRQDGHLEDADLQNVRNACGEHPCQYV
jgi:hypothetical protein